MSLIAFLFRYLWSHFKELTLSPIVRINTFTCMRNLVYKNSKVTHTCSIQRIMLFINYYNKIKQALHWYMIAKIFSIPLNIEMDFWTRGFHVLRRNKSKFEINSIQPRQVFRLRNFAAYFFSEFSTDMISGQRVN